MQDREGAANWNLRIPLGLMKSINKHVILTDPQWKCSINALDVLEVLVKGDELDSQVLRDLRDTFPPTLIEQTRAKFLP